VPVLLADKTVLLPLHIAILDVPLELVIVGLGVGLINIETVFETVADINAHFPCAVIVKVTFPVSPAPGVYVGVTVVDPAEALKVPVDALNIPVPLVTQVYVTAGPDTTADTVGVPLLQALAGADVVIEIGI
jgi:hypothetical protein